MVEWKRWAHQKEVELWDGTPRFFKIRAFFQKSNFGSKTNYLELVATRCKGSSGRLLMRVIRRVRDSIQSREKNEEIRKR